MELLHRQRYLDGVRKVRDDLPADLHARKDIQCLALLCAFTHQQKLRKKPPSLRPKSQKHNCGGARQTPSNAVDAHDGGLLAPCREGRL